MTHLEKMDGQVLYGALRVELKVFFNLSAISCSFRLQKCLFFFFFESYSSLKFGCLDRLARYGYGMQQHVACNNVVNKSLYIAQNVIANME